MQKVSRAVKEHQSVATAVTSIVGAKAQYLRRRKVKGRRTQVQRAIASHGHITVELSGRPGVVGEEDVAVHRETRKERLDGGCRPVLQHILDEN